MPAIIRAATHDEVLNPSGLWAFVDLGYSKSDRTCGLCWKDGASADAKGTSHTFSELIEKLLERWKGHERVFLCLEAPLSMCIGANGNPMERSVERERLEREEGSNGQKPRLRYWYVGAGAAMVVAANDLLARLAKDFDGEIVLLEGFVSFKDRGAPSNHNGDAEALRDALFNQSQASPETPHEHLFTEAELRPTSSARLQSSLFAWPDLSPPLVLQASP